MKILLVALNAKYIHSNLAVYSLKAYYDRGVEALGSRSCAEVSILESTINHSEESVLGNIYKEKPDVVAFSCYLWNISMVLSIGKDLKKVLPNTDIWLGGPEVSYDMEDVLLKHPYIDGIMVGEGEETFFRLAVYYGGKKEGRQDWEEMRKEIEGIAYREKEGRIRVNDSRAPLSLDCIPFPYKGMECTWENRIIYYESSRGCPYSCKYCLSSIEKGVRFRSLSHVKRELEFFLGQSVKQVKFVDRTFNCQKEHAMEIWRFLKEKDNRITNFHFEIAADLLDQEQLQLLASLRPGLLQLEIGVQTANPRTLLGINRKTDLKRIKHCVSWIKKGRNIHQHLDLIAGLPYEDFESFRDSFDQVCSMEPDQLQLGFLKVLKGSAMFLESGDYGIQYRSLPPYEVLCTKWLSYDEILKLKQVEEMVEVYYNSGQFTYSLKYLAHFYESPFDLYLSMGAYYNSHGLNDRKHSRISRYDIFLDFIREAQPQETETIKELLVYDLYLRENLKSRPSFGKDLVRYKEKIKKIYHEVFAEGLWGYEAYNEAQITRLTHMEPFTINIDKTVNNGKAVLQNNYILFDYINRDVLHKEAYTRMIVERNGGEFGKTADIQRGTGEDTGNS